MYGNISIKKQSAAPAAKSNRVIIIDIRDIKTDVTREFGKSSTADSIVLKDGAKAISIQVNRQSISTGYENTGEIDAKVFADHVEFDYSGESVACNNLIEAIANTGVVVIVQSCSGSSKIYGSKCNPLVLSAEPTDNNEARRTHFSFSQEMGDAFVPRVYNGAIPEVWDDYGNWIGAAIWYGDEVWLDY